MITRTAPLEHTVHEISLLKMSTNYFKVLFSVLEAYGKDLMEQKDNITCNSTKDHSIVLELYFKIEPKVSQKQYSKPIADQKRNNKKLTIKVHTGIVVLDAIDNYWGNRDFYETPALVHIKNEIYRSLL